jgi:hypothetical protein
MGMERWEGDGAWVSKLRGNRCSSGKDICNPAVLSIGALGDDLCRGEGG